MRKCLFICIIIFLSIGILSIEEIVTHQKSERTSTNNKTPDRFFMISNALKSTVKLQIYLKPKLINDSYDILTIPREYYDKSRQYTKICSGIIVSKDGYILTVAHTIANATRILVQLHDKQQSEANIVGIDPDTDLAVLKISDSNLILRPAEFCNSDSINVGDEIFVLGAPYNLDNTVTHGIISGIGSPNIKQRNFSNLIQTDAPINPGNSGGPLINIHGLTLGIITTILTEDGVNKGIGFATPINDARKVINDIIKFGRVIRGYIGVDVQNLTHDISKAVNIPHTNGVIVTNVFPQSPAEYAGISKGDIILRLNDEIINNTLRLKYIIEQTMPNEIVNIELCRNGKYSKVRVKLREAPNLSVKNNICKSSLMQYSPKNSPWEGMNVCELTPKIRNYLNLNNDVYGVMIKQIDINSTAYIAGLRVGNIIREINKCRIMNLDDLEYLKNKKWENPHILIYAWTTDGNRFFVIKSQE